LKIFIIVVANRLKCPHLAPALSRCDDHVRVSTWPTLYGRSFTRLSR